MRSLNDAQTASPRSHPNPSCTVQVYTSLPPGINAPVTAYLNLRVSLFRLARNSTANRRRGKATQSRDDLSVRVRWWGEPVGEKCAIFVPRLAHKVGHKQFTRTKARYKITVPLDRFSAYLEDMRALYFDVLEQPGPHAIGRARLDRIERLLPEHPIDSILTVLDDVGEKIGELTVSLSIEEVLNGSVKDGNHCDHSVPVAVIGTGSQQVGPIDGNPDYVEQLPTVHSRQLDNIAVSRTRPNPSEGQLSDPEGTNLRENCHYCSKSRLDEDIDPFYVKGAPCAPNTFGEHALDLRSSVSSEVSNDDKLEKRCPAVPESANDHCSAFENARHVNVAQGKDAGDYPAPEEQTRCPNEAPAHSSGVRSSKEDGTSRVNASSNLPVLLRSPSSSELHCSTTKGCDIAFAENYLGDSDRGVAHSPTEAFFPTLPNHHSDASKRLTDLELNLIEEQPLSSPTWNKYGNSPFGELLADGQLVEELFPDPTSTKLLPFKVIPHGRTPGTTNNSLHFPQHSTLGVSQKRKMHELQAIRIHIQCVNLTREFSRVLSTSAPGDDRLLRPKIVNMKTDGIPTALREPGRSSERPHPPKSLPASSVTTSRILKSRSASPKGNRELRHLTLETSVPMHSLKDSHLVYMTNTCRLSMENSTRHPHATGFAQSPDASTVRLVPESLDQSTSLVNLTDLPSPTEEYIRFRLFFDANSSFTQPVSEFIGSGDLPIEDLKAAITEKVLARNDPAARLSLPVYSHLLMRSSMRSSREKLYQTNPHGHIELILEPHWSVTPRHESDATPPQMHQSVRFKEPIKPDNFPSTLKQTQSIPLDTLVSVSHGRGLRLSERDQSGGVSIQPAEHTYLTVRLPWCQAESDERTASSAKRTTCRFKSVVCWTGGQCPTYKFALKTSCILDEKLLLRLSRSVAVIEVWATFISGSPDRLIGLSKLPLDALANTFARLDPQAQSVTLYSEAVLKAILSYAHPAIAINQWIPVIDPFTGSECGQIRVRLAAGTPDQINTLQMTDSQGRSVIDPDGRGWEALDIIRWPKFCPSPEEESAGDFAEHCLTVTIESLQEFDPHSALRSDAELGGSVPWGDCDCFVQYYFPSGTRPDALARHRTPVQLLVAPTLETITGELKPTTHLVSCKFRTASKPSNEDLGNIAPLEPYWSQQHRVCLCVRRRRIERGTEGLGDCRRSLQRRGFLHWLLDAIKHMSTTVADRSSEPNIGLPFELWLRIYSPSLRDCLVSRGCVTVAILSELINQNNSDADRSAHYTHCSIHLRDVHLERTNGRLNLGLTYSMRNMKPPIRKTTRSPTQLITFDSSMPSQSASEHFSYPDVQLIQNVCLPGVRMTVQLHGLTGLAPSSKSPRSVGFCGHVRLHCLLIRNTGSVGSESCQCLVLGSAASNPLRGSYFANNLDTNLEVLLPFSWRYLSTGSPAEPYRDLNVIELLLNGEEMLPFHSAAQSFSKWALILQVDLWQQSSVDNIAVDLLNSGKSSFFDMGWNGLDSGESLKNIHPGAGYKLFASSRIPLGGLLFSNRGCIPKRMYPLCRFLKQSTSSVPCGRFGGGVELSAQFVDGLRGRYRLLEYAVRHHTEETELMHCIRRWAIPLPLLSSSNGDDESTIELDEEPCLWHNGIDEYGHAYKHITIHLDAAKLPSAETLLAERSSIVESPAPDLNLFAGYTFVRFQFYRHGTQTTRMVPLPCGLGRCVSGIVEFSDQKQYTLHVSSDCRSYLTDAELEFQVWALWTHRMGQPTSSHIEESDIAVGVEGLMQERPHLDIDPPSPCFIGSTRITLSRLLFHSSRHIAPNTNESVVEIDGAIASGYVSVSGDPSGLKWWPMGSHLHPPRCAQPLPVFPIYRTNSSFLHDSWIAIRISMHGSRSQLNIRPISESRAPIDPNADGQLGWNLGACPAVPRLAYPQTRMSVGGQEIGDESIETTFPAEIIVELAYHLKATCSTSLSGATKENTNCLSPSDFVFVTFPVDGDKTGTLSSYDGLWTRVANARKKPISGRIAVTTKVPMGTSVCWNYRRFVRLPTWLVEPRTRRALPFHVWLERHADIDPVSNCDPSSMGCKPELIGIASVDLTSLSGLFSSVGPGGCAPNGTVSGGLDQVYGWYNVVNSCGTHCGQILLGVRPLIPGLKSATSLSRFGSTELLDLDRQPFQSDVPIDGRFTCSSPLSRMRRILSSGPSTNMPGESTRSVPDLNAAGLITQDATTSGFGTDLDLSSLFHNLRTQLNELDNINSKFRQRLTQGTNLYCPVTVAEQDSNFAKAQVSLGSSSPPGQQASAGDNSKILLVDCQTSDELGQPVRLISKPGKGCKASGPLPSGRETSVGCVASDNIAANEVMVPLQKSNSACPLQLELAEEGTLDQVISPEVGERCLTITSVDCSDHLPCLDLSVCSDAGTHSINLDESQHSLPFEENDRLSQQTSRLLASPCSPRPERGDSELQFEFSPVEERDQHSSSEICDVSPLLVRSEMEPEDAVTMRCELSAELSSRSSKETLRENAVGEVLDGEQDAAQNEDITWSFPGNPTRVLEKPAGGVELDEPLDRSSPTSRSASHSQLLMPKSPPINEKATEPAAQIDNLSFALVPDFFPPPSAFSKTVFGSETKSDASDSLTARLMQLRSGLRETMESMAPQTSSTLSSHKDQFEVLRHRVDARIAGVLDRMDKGANLSSGAKPNDPLLSVLNGLRPRSLQVAERAFSWEEPK